MANINLRKVIAGIFMLAFTVSEILWFEMFDLENFGQGYVVQHLQWSHSMENINIYKCHTRAFFLLALTIFQILAFHIL